MLGIGLGITQQRGSHWHPLLLGSTLKEWLRADLTTSISSKVSAITDKSGNGNNGAQSDSTKRTASPAVGSLNSQLCMTFTGAEMYQTPASVAGAKTVIIVAKLASAPGSGFSLSSTVDRSEHLSTHNIHRRCERERPKRTRTRNRLGHQRRANPHPHL